MPYVADSRATEHLKKFLPREALELFCKAYNTAEACENNHNACVMYAWQELQKAGWRKPATGKKYVKDDPSPGSVHVDSVIGSKKPKPKKPPIEDCTSMKNTFEATGDICKVDSELGLVFGFAIVCKKDGADYYDVQGDHIPEASMLHAGVDFMENSRVAKEMHAGDQKGSVVFAFPLTTDIAKSLGITTNTTGFLIAMKPPADVLAKYKSGEYTGFSIGGQRITDEEVAD